MQRCLLIIILLVAVGTAGLIYLKSARAHCDTMDGPVVMAAKTALVKKDITPVLKWVKPESEPELRAAFKQTLAVRSKGPEAIQLADTYFFETLVRLHRAGEGAPYAGLQPAGTDLGPAIQGADQALKTGSVDNLVKLITNEVTAGIRARFARAHGLSKHQNESVQAGREYVEAYVEFVHYVERLDLDAKGAAGHQEVAPTAEHGH